MTIIKLQKRLREDIDKKINNTYTIKQAVQWPTSVALNTHTLKGVVCCNRWQAKDGNGLKLEKVGPTFQV